jgi:hypothetical protein
MFLQNVDLQWTTWHYITEDRTLQYSLLLTCCLSLVMKLVTDQILNIFSDISFNTVLFLIQVCQISLQLKCFYFLQSALLGALVILFPPSYSVHSKWCKTSIIFRLL